MTDAAEEGRHETDKERLDRNLNELLGELRVALPGVQVLFAFLLAVPFNQGFQRVTSFQRNVYLGTMLLTTVATALLIAPSAYHRIEFRKDDKRHIVFMANRFAIAGFGFLAGAMSSAILLVTDFLFSRAAAIGCTAGAVVLLFGLWFVEPIRRRNKIGR